MKQKRCLEGRYKREDDLSFVWIIMYNEGMHEWSGHIEVERVYDHMSSRFDSEKPLCSVYYERMETYSIVSWGWEYLSYKNAIDE